MTPSNTLKPEQQTQIWLSIFKNYTCGYNALPPKPSEWKLQMSQDEAIIPLDVREHFLTHAVAQKELIQNPKTNQYQLSESSRLVLNKRFWGQLKQTLKLSPTAKRLLHHLIELSNRDGRLNYQKEKWAESCGLSSSAMTSALKELKYQGVGCLADGGKYFILTNQPDLAAWLDAQHQPKPVVAPKPELNPKAELTVTLEPNLKPKELSKPVQILLQPASTTPPLPASAGVTYFVDTENANNASFYQGLNHLKPTDEVILMMTQNTRIFGQASLLHCLLSECPAKISTYYSDVSGHNALDFVLVSQLTLRLAQNPTGCLRIISADKGFKAALEHLTGVLSLKPGQIGLQASFQSLKVA